MVGVRGVSGGAATGTGRALRSAGGGFNLGGVPAGVAAAARGVAPAQPIGLLALQEAGPVAERDARARHRGQALLRSLTDLQLALLGGAMDPARLRDLAALVPGEEAADPALAAAMAAIRLRARVELARHGLDAAASPD
ncbi:flagellar assembly protein FliX [Roseomonas sp. CAU 1739]|uniref:flagellar assembly protein FliX n=1 Tax=Roseomonas sp. CAU 1739 TaxID=3140364 RepID=UPI00325BCB23